jgi:hypothetical protein
MARPWSGSRCAPTRSSRTRSRIPRLAGRWSISPWLAPAEPSGPAPLHQSDDQWERRSSSRSGRLSPANTTMRLPAPIGSTPSRDRAEPGATHPGSGRRRPGQPAGHPPQSSRVHAPKPQQSPVTRHCSQASYAPPTSAPGAKPFSILGAGTATAARQVEFGRDDRSCGYRRITMQVRVRVTPSTTWMRETTSRPS